MSEPGDHEPILSVVFYATAAGNEPVRDWLLGLSRDDRRAVGFDIKTAQHGWPATDTKTAKQRLADLKER